MPVEVRALYEEAREVAGVSPRAGAALARATLERLLPLVDSDPGHNLSFNRRIERVSRVVTSGLAGMLDVIRHAGNKSLHEGASSDDILTLVLDDTSTGTLDLLFIAINELVDERITKVAMFAKLSERLPEGVRRGIIDRAARTGNLPSADDDRERS